MENAELLFVDGRSGIYSIKRKNDGRLVIMVNRNSNVFKAFKNPLFLLGLIKIEVELCLKSDQKMSEFLEKKRPKMDKTRD